MSPFRRDVGPFAALIGLFVSAVAAPAAAELRPRVLRIPAELRDAADLPELPREVAGRALVEAVLAAEGHPRTPASRLLPSGSVPAGGDVTEFRLRQELGGIPVFRGRHASFLRADGTPLAVRLGEVADPGEPGPFLLDSLQAVVIADAARAGELDGLPDSAFRQGASTAGERVGTVAGFEEVALPGLSDTALVRRTIVADGPRSAWEVDIPSRTDVSRRWLVLVDATTGDVLHESSLTRDVAAFGRVFPAGPLGSSHELRPFVDEREEMHPGSPAGWVAVDMTQGNNAYVYDDRMADGDNTFGLQAMGVGDPLMFDFPFTGVPADDLDAALTNAFWAVNRAHDRFFELGFQPGSGVIQTEHFAGVERGGDHARVYVQYRAGADGTAPWNSGSVSIQADGVRPSIYAGLWDRSGELRDGALDTGLLIHEYAHAVVGRLVGNHYQCDDGIQPRGLAEGWADYFAASMTGDTRIGAWVSGDETNGLRTKRIDENTYTYWNLCAIDYECSNNGNGEIWAGALWALREAFVDAYGEEAGVDRAERLIVAGMRYTPCQPTFVDAARGIVLAELALTDGVDHCLAWGALASRGLGLSATSAGPDDRYPFPAFDVPASCADGASVSFERERYGDDADALLVVSDATAGSADRTVQVGTSSGDAESFVASGPLAVRQVIVPLRPGAPVPGDGIVQVAEGDVVDASCSDCVGAPSASADVSRALDVSIVYYSIYSESCLDDNSQADVSEFRSYLPSVLDAGERVTMTISIGNGEPFPLEDVWVSASSDHPGVHVLPGGMVPLAERVPGGLGIPRPMDLRLRAYAEPTVAFGEVATLTFDVRARGLEGVTQLTIPLAADYQAERDVSAWGGTETFEDTSPSAALWTHAPAAGQPADLWGIQDCGDGGGKAMAYAGAGCTDYDDTPSAATLVSPPLFDLSGNVWHVAPKLLTWRNDVDLGREERSLYCDSEQVNLYLTDDPARPRYEAPLSDRGGTTTQYWVQWTGLGNERNTNGWETGAPAGNISVNTTRYMDWAEVRLYWVFFTDVYNPETSGGCRIDDPDAVGGGYKLDNVTFEYDLVRLVPQADTTCAVPCTARAQLTITPGPGRRCPGMPVTVSGVFSDGAGCPGGELEYRLRGPGLDTGYGPLHTVVATAGEAGTWSLNVRCVQDTSCSDSMSIPDPTLDESQAGRPYPDSLRVRRTADDVMVSWSGTRSPATYALFRANAPLRDAAGRAAVLAELATEPPPSYLRAGSPDGVAHRDPDVVGNGAELQAYRIFGRSPCSGEVAP